MTFRNCSLLNNDVLSHQRKSTRHRLSNRSFKMPLKIFISFFLFILKLNTTPMEEIVKLLSTRLATKKFVGGLFFSMSLQNKTHQVLLSCCICSLRLARIYYVLLFSWYLKSSVVMFSSEYAICRGEKKK